MGHLLAKPCWRNEVLYIVKCVIVSSAVINISYFCCLCAQFSCRGLLLACSFGCRRWAGFPTRERYRFLIKSRLPDMSGDLG